MTPIKTCRVCYYTDGLEYRTQKWERLMWGSKEGKGRDSNVVAGTWQNRLIFLIIVPRFKVRDLLMIHNLTGWQAKY